MHALSVSKRFAQVQNVDAINLIIFLATNCSNCRQPHSLLLFSSCVAARRSLLRAREACELCGRALKSIWQLANHSLYVLFCCNAAGKIINYAARMQFCNNINCHSWDMQCTVIVLKWSGSSQSSAATSPLPPHKVKVTAAAAANALKICCALARLLQA